MANRAATEKSELEAKLARLEEREAKTRREAFETEAEIAATMEMMQLRTLELMHAQRHNKPGATPEKDRK